MVEDHSSDEGPIRLTRIQEEILRFGRYLLTFGGIPAYVINVFPSFRDGTATLALQIETAVFLTAAGMAWVAKGWNPRVQVLILGIPVFAVSVLSLGQYGPSFGTGVLQMAVLSLFLVFFYQSIPTFFLVVLLVLLADLLMATAIIQGWIETPDLRLLDATDPATWHRVLISSATAVPITAFLLARVLRGLHDSLRESESRLEELRREQEAREEAQRALNRAQRMEVVGRLASGLSHDFNNTLTLIRGSAELLEMELTREEDRELAEDILRAADNAADLSRRLLIFSRQGETSDRRPVDTGEALQRLGKSLRRLLPSNIEVTPESSATRRAHVDPSQLDQAVLNLCLNARDAMPRGGRLVLTARDGTRADGEPAVVVEVRDTGVGMDRDVLALATEPFFSTKAEGRGTGLGLSMVKKMVDQHGGTLAVESEPGKGSTFQLVLPACTDEAVEPARPVPAPGEGGRILLLDDDAALRRVLARTLEDRGYSVVAVGREEEAKALLAGGQSFHLLLTDGTLPAEGSASMARTFLDRSPAGQVLVYSGLPRESLVERGIPSGDRITMVQKPMASPELLALVGERVARAKAG